MQRKFLIISAILLFLVTGCDNTDPWLATEAGIEAVTAVTLSDEAVRKLAENSAEYMDREHVVAPADSEYARRLERLVGGHLTEDGIQFNYKVYLDDQVNAFAMADGTVRVYKGLLDLLDDGELRFVIGHEMGHVAKDHVRRKMQLAYAASAIRKGIASQSSTLGDLARSQVGGFAELFVGAQFSQLEEKAADDYGLNFLRREGYSPGDAVSALRKLDSLGGDHSFLSSHPDPADRAERMQLQIEGKAQPIEETSKNIIQKILAIVYYWLTVFFDSLSSIFDRIIS